MQPAKDRSFKVDHTIWPIPPDLREALSQIRLNLVQTKELVGDVSAQKVTIAEAQMVLDNQTAQEDLEPSLLHLLTLLTNKVVTRSVETLLKT